MSQGRVEKDPQRPVYVISVAATLVAAVALSIAVSTVAVRRFTGKPGSEPEPAPAPG